MFRAALPRPIWLARLDRSRPTLYFTMGSTGDTQFFNEAAKVFGGTAYQVLITTAGLPVELYRKYDNVFIEELADGDSLMGVSHVAITHGATAPSIRRSAAACQCWASRRCSTRKSTCSASSRWGGPAHGAPRLLCRAPTRGHRKRSSAMGTSVKRRAD